MRGLSLERRLLQAAIVIAAAVPVCAGGAGAVLGARLLALLPGLEAALPSSLALDSHFRYLSGLLCALGLAFWAAVPAVERKTLHIRLLAFPIVLGGLARLYGLFAAAVPPPLMLAALAMELVATPLLCLWQARIAAAFRDAPR